MLISTDEGIRLHREHIRQNNMVMERTLFFGNKWVHKINGAVQASLTNEPGLALNERTQIAISIHAIIINLSIGFIICYSIGMTIWRMLSMYVCSPTG